MARAQEKGPAVLLNGSLELPVLKIVSDRENASSEGKGAGNDEEGET